MKNTGTLRIQTFAARQSAPVEGVTVAVQGDGFTLHCITDATGSAADIPVEAPACALSLDEDNTTRPYAIVSLTAAKPGYRTVRIEGIQICSPATAAAARTPWRTACPGAEPGHHPQEHHGASGQAGGFCPQRDGILPGLYRKRCFQ